MHVRSPKEEGGRHVPRKDRKGDGLENANRDLIRPSSRSSAWDSGSEPASGDTADERKSRIATRAAARLLVT